MGLPYSKYPAINNETRKPTVTPSTFTITDDDDAADYFRAYVFFNTAAGAPRAVGVGLAATSAGQGPLIFTTSGGSVGLWNVLNFASASSFLVSHSAAPTGTQVYAKIDSYTDKGVPIMKLVSDLPSNKNATWVASNGVKIVVEADSLAAEGYAVHCDSINPDLTFVNPALGPDTGGYLMVLDNSTYIEMRSVTSSMDPAMFVDDSTATAATMSATFGGASNVNYTTISITNGIGAIDLFLSPLYFDEDGDNNARFLHDFSFVPGDVDFRFGVGNELVSIAYSASASSTGVAVYGDLSSGPPGTIKFVSPTNTDGTAYTSSEYVPNQFVKSA